MCWWEQRGAGLSYSPGIPPESMTVEQLIADTIAVTDYLRERFGQDKIYLLGHSWGSFLGIQVAGAGAGAVPRLHRHGADVASASSPRSSPTSTCSTQYRKRGNAEDGAEARGSAGHHGRAPAARPYMRLRDPVMHGLGVGTTRDMKSVVTGIFLPGLADVPEYTLAREDQHLARQGVLAAASCGTTSMSTDLTAKVPELEIPAYFCRAGTTTRSLRPGQGLLRRAARAGEGLLHLRALGPQPGVRGAREDAADPARGRAGRRDRTRRPRPPPRCASPCPSPARCRGGGTWPRRPPSGRRRRRRGGRAPAR